MPQQIFETREEPLSRRGVEAPNRRHPNILRRGQSTRVYSPGCTKARRSCDLSRLASAARAL
jgi:hypothetical protein